MASKKYYTFKKDKNAINLKDYIKKNEKLILVSSEGRFDKILKNKNKKLKLIFLNKTKLDILNIK